ncbi:MAG: anthranilate synthase component I family protein [Nannocystaceae bacterium]|nr:anthranilate synthase component I family protein [Nannocystaceae bacterium]
MSDTGASQGLAGASQGLAAGLCGLSAAGLPGFAWLDGGDAHDGGGMVAAWPDLEIVGEDLAVLDEVQRAWRARPDAVWIGWLSYELGAADTLGRAVTRSALPGLCMRRYPAALRLGAGAVQGQHGDASRLRAALAAVTPIGAQWPWPLQSLSVRIEPEEHRRRVRAAQTRIVAGDTYQVNLSQPMRAAWTGQAEAMTLGLRTATLYAGLRHRFPASMGGLVSTPVGTIVSNSPETLLTTTVGAGEDGGVLAQSWPIKGTRPRGASPEADAALVDALRRSEKDGAEHVMIVDLVRNDLGRLAVPGSVAAPSVAQLLTLPTVHHLITEVSATLRTDVELTELVRAMFPGGSITGAPKRSTVGIIDGLEQHRRGIYCGALVLLQPSGVTLSIAIRTGLADAHGLSLCSGGGIVVDSDPEAERLETLDKAAAFAGPGV